MSTGGIAENATGTTRTELDADAREALYRARRKEEENALYAVSSQTYECVVKTRLDKIQNTPGASKEFYAGRDSGRVTIRTNMLHEDDRSYGGSEAYIRVEGHIISFHGFATSFRKNDSAPFKDWPINFPAEINAGNPADIERGFKDFHVVLVRYKVIPELPVQGRKTASATLEIGKGGI